ncbi:MAG: PhoU domain-containing protein [Malacoplasma sp.]
MAINIHSLIKSEKELSDNFVSLFKLCFKMHTRLLEYLNNNSINETTLEKFSIYKNKVTELKNHIRDDCIWIISKDQPRSTHLRYIIAILYSIKDLERISEYAYNIFYYSYKLEISDSYKKEMMTIISKSNETFCSLMDMFEKNIVINLEDLYMEEINKFKDFYKSFVKKNFSKLKLSADKNSDDFYQFSIMIKYTERTIDHIESIFNNFIMIKSF